MEVGVGICYEVVDNHANQYSVAKQANTVFSRQILSYFIYVFFVNTCVIYICINFYKSIMSKPVYMLLSLLFYNSTIYVI